MDPRYLHLLLTVEDKRFRNHGGVDAGALLRAAWQYARLGRIVSGGSTLSMQTARLLEPHRRSVLGKLHDMLRAWQLEERYGKDEILAMYLTLAPFGGNVEGVRAASLIWFGHDADRLSEAEAALLVAIPQSPARRRPGPAFRGGGRARPVVCWRGCARRVRCRRRGPMAGGWARGSGRWCVTRFGVRRPMFCAGLARAAPAGP